MIIAQAALDYCNSESSEKKIPKIFRLPNLCSFQIILHLKYGYKHHDQVYKLIWDDIATWCSISTILSRDTISSSSSCTMYSKNILLASKINNHFKMFCSLRVVSLLSLYFSLAVLFLVKKKTAASIANISWQRLPKWKV